MKNVDVELIQRVLEGDDTAFSTLVRKYQKQVHALAWRKVEDFHIAEDITQETFLKAYQKLPELKEPHSFASWLYVIATNRCNSWLRKKRLGTQPLEDTNSAELEKATYSSYVIAEKERTVAEAQREVVKKLLAKLQESDRTVITLYYLGGMTYEEISRFLGVSVSAIKNRLYRARQRLQKEETMIREALEHFQISPSLTDNIMQEVARLKPATPSGGKPLMPWIAAASSVVLIVFMFGLGSQYLARFQKPYSLDAQAETTVELVDAPIVQNVDAKPDVQRELGSSDVLGKSDNNGQKPDEILLAAAQAEGEDVSTPKQQWILSEPIYGSLVQGICATEEKELYAVNFARIYKWQDDKTGWQQVSADITKAHDKQIEINSASKVPIAKWDNTLYIVLQNLFLASEDDGKNWKIVHSWTDDYRLPYKLVLTDQAFWVQFNNAVFRSVDKGQTWKDVDVELFQGSNAFIAIQNTVYVGSNTGLYRWNTDRWERVKLPVPEAILVTSAAATKDRLYVMASLGSDSLDDKAAQEGQQRTWWIFRSTDLGNSWEDITPTNAWPVKGLPPDINLVAAGETLLLMGQGLVRSTDGGDTWMPPQASTTFPMKVSSDIAPVAVNESTFFVTRGGLHRSTDAGQSWEKVRITQNKMRYIIENLIKFNENRKMPNRHPTLYGIDVVRIVKTTDQGKSWNTVQVEMPMTMPVREDQPRIYQLTTTGDVIYARGQSDYPIGELRFYRVSEDGDTLVPIQGIPTFDSRRLRDHLRKHQNLSIETLQGEFSGATQFFNELLISTPQQQERLIRRGLNGTFAVSDDTFYMEYNFKLFRWEPGDTEWQDIRQEKTSSKTRGNLKLAVSGDTVYVGKRDGHLVVSFNRGDNWIDLTPAMPFPVTTFKEIMVAGSTVYVATDAGMITSDDGKNWHTLTDAKGTNLIMEQLAVDGTTLYGITKKTDLYILESDTGTWKQIITEIPEGEIMDVTANGTSLIVAGSNLYLGTVFEGILHLTLEQ
ncbi:hypothetical protein C6501_05535 [Candidatus Poribacteria bacterium]|nr:MAG: hypothetical protein C6501_05535 [Candidatus Poribacteria bacterium]